MANRLAATAHLAEPLELIEVSLADESVFFVSHGNFNAEGKNRSEY
jgi:hypothetical protein